MSRGTLLIAILIALGAAAVVADLVLPRDDIGFLSVPCFCLAGVVSVRKMFCHLHAQWQGAFDMGREVGHEEGVRSLRPRR